MFDVHYPTLMLTAFPGIVLLALVHRSWSRRLHALEEDLFALSAALERINESHDRSLEHMSGSLAEVEERLMDLSVPSGDLDLPLERRHRVLSLARKGVPVDRIARTLNVPRCEAELILSLQSYAASSPPAAKAAGDASRHAQA